MTGNQPSKHTFHCLRCSNCCYFRGEYETPILLPHEVALLKVIARRLHIGEKLVFKKLDSGLYRWVISEYCPFYQPATKSCMIHHDKPLACKMYPLVVNLTTMELSLSRACTWVNQSSGVLERAVADPSEAFPNEMKAVRELLEILRHASSDGLVVVLVENFSEEASSLSGIPCKLIKIHSSSSARGLHLVYLAGCNSDEVEQALESAGINVVAVAEFAVSIDH